MDLFRHDEDENESDEGAKVPSRPPTADRASFVIPVPRREASSGGYQAAVPEHISTLPPPPFVASPAPPAPEPSSTSALEENLPDDDAWGTPSSVHGKTLRGIPSAPPAAAEAAGSKGKKAHGKKGTAQAQVSAREQKERAKNKRAEKRASTEKRQQERRERTEAKVRAGTKAPAPRQPKAPGDKLKKKSKARAQGAVAVPSESTEDREVLAFARTLTGSTGSSGPAAVSQGGSSVPWKTVAIVVAAALTLATLGAVLPTR
jgi:hypothetical protein